MSDTIQCPHCNQLITINDAIRHQFEPQIEAKYKQQLAQSQQETQAKLAVIAQREAELQKQEQQIQTEVREQTEKQLEPLKKQLWEKAQTAAADKLGVEVKDLREQLKEKTAKAAQWEEQELALRKQMRELEDAQKQVELEVSRKLDAERKQLSENITKALQEENRLKLLEKDKLLEDTKKALQEAQRKAGQGSQQTQGEVLELDLEYSLRDTFNQDQIVPVAKGVSGADIMQTVRNGSQKACGVILWEIKQTKHWAENWVSKLKEDLRRQKAHIPVLVSTQLPVEVEHFGYYQGIWVSQPAYALALAVVLRNNLISVAYERMAAAGKGEKVELLYNYVCSHLFRQRVEAVVEVFTEMQIQIAKEQTAFARMWKQREGQIQRLCLNTAGMYGEMQGLIGNALPEIKGLELASGEEAMTAP